MGTCMSNYNTVNQQYSGKQIMVNRNSTCDSFEITKYNGNTAIIPNTDNKINNSRNVNSMITNNDTGNDNIHDIDDNDFDTQQFEGGDGDDGDDGNGESGSNHMTMNRV